MRYQTALRPDGRRAVLYLLRSRASTGAWIPANGPMDLRFLQGRPDGIVSPLVPAYAAPRLDGHIWRTIMALRKFIIERDIPAVGSLEREQLSGAAAQSNKVLRELGPDIQWVESYVAADKTFCVYLAKDEGVIRKHAEMSGFPATKITEVRKMIDPTTEKAA